MFFTFSAGLFVILFLKYLSTKSLKEEQCENVVKPKKVSQNTDSVFYDDYDEDLCRDSRNNIIKINDIISITEEEVDYEIDPRRPRRAISTYSKIDVQPQDFEHWCVTDIVTTIPNVKNYRNLEKSEKNVNPYLMVYPVGKSLNGYDLEKDDIETFWFIDIKYKTINQFEDGAVISNVKEIKVIK